MTENNKNSVWKHNTLEVDNNGYVTGVAYTPETENGCSVTVSISSYEFDNNSKINHVPNVVVQDKTGAIESEPHAHDSMNPEKAIQNALSMGEYAFENIEKFVDND